MYQQKYNKYKRKYLLANYIKQQIGGNIKYEFNDAKTLLNKIKDGNEKNYHFTISKFNTNLLTAARTLIETKTYKIIKFVGSGTYAKVYTVKDISTEEIFVLKLGVKHLKTTFEEAERIKLLFDIEDIDKCCKYNLEAYGINENFSFIIMTNLGELSLFDYIENYKDNECNMKYLSIYLYQIVKCLIKYNKHIFHNDMKIENIVIDLSKKKATIIDFGLYTNLSNEFTELGYQQQPPEYILYNIAKIELQVNKVDNFGLFWIIIDSLTNCELWHIYSPIEKDFKPKSYKELLYFYLNINNIKRSDFKGDFLRILNTYFNDFNEKDNFLVEFKDIAYENTNFYIKKNIFNDDKAYFDNFIDLLIRLVYIKINDKIDLTGRIHMSELLCHEFFTKKI
jgi:serine/threonine protein kinase